MVDRLRLTLRLCHVLLLLLTLHRLNMIEDRIDDIVDFREGTVTVPLGDERL